MSISVTKQLLDFALSLLIGALLGAVYDVFRISRLVAARGRVAVFFQDLFFFVLCAVVTFLFVLIDNSGEVRAFLLLGELLGALLYYFTLGTLVMKTARRAVGPARRAAGRAARAIRAPAVRAAHSLGSGLQRNGESVKKICTKGFEVFKIRLQGHKKMLYNQIQSKCKQGAAVRGAAEHDKTRGRRRHDAHEKGKKA